MDKHLCMIKSGVAGLMCKPMKLFLKQTKNCDLIVNYPVFGRFRAATDKLMICFHTLLPGTIRRYTTLIQKQNNNQCSNDTQIYQNWKNLNKLCTQVEKWWLPFFGMKRVFIWLILWNGGLQLQFMCTAKRLISWDVWSKIDDVGNCHLALSSFTTTSVLIPLPKPWGKLKFLLGTF